MNSPSVSVIIPTLNEAHTLPQVLERLGELDPKPDEIIVVDGGSEDGTMNIAKLFNIRCLSLPKKGRAAQLDFGVRQAQGDHVIFLHADTLVPLDLVACVQRTLSKPKVALGGFIAIMKGKKVRTWFTFLNYIKTYVCPMFYRPGAFFRQRLLLLFGDQVMFCRRADYLKAGGFDVENQVMEEADLCLKMSEMGRVTMLQRRVYSSDRRVNEWGFWKANRIYWSIAFGWVFGVSDKKLAILYPDVR